MRFYQHDYSFELTSVDSTSFRVLPTIEVLRSLMNPVICSWVAERRKAARWAGERIYFDGCRYEVDASGWSVIIYSYRWVARVNDEIM